MKDKQIIYPRFTLRLRRMAQTSSQSITKLESKIQSRVT